jgi:hypothetical protein
MAFGRLLCSRTNAKKRLELEMTLRPRLLTVWGGSTDKDIFIAEAINDELPQDQLID